MLIPPYNREWVFLLGTNAIAAAIARQLIKEQARLVVVGTKGDELTSIADAPGAFPFNADMESTEGITKLDEMINCFFQDNSEGFTSYVFVLHGDVHSDVPDVLWPARLRMLLTYRKQSQPRTSFTFVLPSSMLSLSLAARLSAMVREQSGAMKIRAVTYSIFVLTDTHTGPRLLPTPTRVARAVIALPNLFPDVSQRVTVIDPK